MKKRLTNKKGMALPTVLAIVVFIIGTAVSLMAISFSQTKLVDQATDNSEAYHQAIYQVDAAVQTIIRELLIDSSFLDNPTNISDVEAYFDVNIEPYGSSTSLWQVTSIYNTDKSVISYISTAASGSMTEEQAGDLLSFFGSGITTDYSDMPEELLAEHLPTYFELYEIDASEPKPSDLDSIKSIAKYIDRKTSFIEIPAYLLNYNYLLAGDFVVDGNVFINSNRNIYVEEGRTLFITGNLTMGYNSSIYGNVVVGNNLTMYGSWYGTSEIIGTLFVNNTVNTYGDVDFGTETRPSFVFAATSVTLEGDGDGYIYFISPKFTLDGYSTTVVNVYGGVYADNIDIRRGTLNEYLFDLRTVYEYFETFALPYSGEAIGDGSYTYTDPK